VLRGMFGLNGLVLPFETQTYIGWVPATGSTWFSFGQLEAFAGMRQLAWISVLLVVVWTCPNSQSMITRVQKSRIAVRLRHERWAWLSLGALAVLTFLLAAINGSRGSSEFIYFNF